MKHQRPKVQKWVQKALIFIFIFLSHLFSLIAAVCLSVKQHKCRMCRKLRTLKKLSQRKGTVSQCKTHSRRSSERLEVTTVDTTLTLPTHFLYSMFHWAFIGWINLGTAAAGGWVPVVLLSNTHAHTRTDAHTLNHFVMQDKSPTCFFQQTASGPIRALCLKTENHEGTR